MHKIKRILVLFVEPMLYNMDLIHEVYDKTEYAFFFLFCGIGLTGKDDLKLPENSFVCSGSKKKRQEQAIAKVSEFQPDFIVINGYVGIEQTTLIRYCQKNRIQYAIESDTQLNVPSNKLKAILKKLYLKNLLHNDLCFGFPGGTLQKKNLMYYGIPEEKNFIMPMCVSEKRLMDESGKLPSKHELRKEMGLPDKFTYLFVGRLEEVKNVQLLLEAFDELHQQRKNIFLLIVGDGSLRNALEQYVTEHHLEDVVFAGYIVFPEIVKYYKAADIFVLPSSYEPWGLVVNEAMVMELPVIASSDVGCGPDMIDDGKNGFIFESNHKVDLINKMGLVNESDYFNFADSARKKAKTWNLAYYLDCFTGAIKYAENAER